MYVCVRVCASVRACVHVCVRVRVCVGESERVGVCVYAYLYVFVWVGAYVRAYVRACVIGFDGVCMRAGVHICMYAVSRSESKRQ